MGHRNFGLVVGFVLLQLFDPLLYRIERFRKILPEVIFAELHGGDLFAVTQTLQFPAEPVHGTRKSMAQLERFVNDEWRQGAQCEQQDDVVVPDCRQCSEETELEASFV
jgi:carboxylesterase type B